MSDWTAIGTSAAVGPADSESLGGSVVGDQTLWRRALIQSSRLIDN